MAAPHKKGLDYFSHDCNLDHKIDIVEARFGLIGYGVYFKLLEIIYSQGESLNVNEDFWLVFFAKKCQIDYDKGMEIVEFLVKKNLFDSQEFEKGVLTSSGIKKRFAEATKRRKPLSVQNTAQSEVNVSNNEVNVNINSINADINSQSKVKESKVKESKVKESKVNTNYLTNSENQNFQNQNQQTEEIKSEIKNISLKNFTAENLEYQLISKQTTKTAFELWRRNFPNSYRTALENFIAWQNLKDKEYPSMEALMQHLGRYTNDKDFSQENKIEPTGAKPNHNNYQKNRGKAKNL